MENQERKNKYDINQLVSIGDMMHETELSLIITSKLIEKNEKEEVLVSMLGDREVLTQMIFEVCLKDENVFHLLSDAIMAAQLAKLEQIIK